ncbi:MAG: PqqD family protein [Candidatus Aminicenantaceae bacterium]
MALKAKEDIVWRDKEGLLVLLNTSTGHYYTVNKTGARLWTNLIDKGMSFDAAIKKIREEFKNTPDDSTLKSHCAEMIEQWKSENLIEEEPTSDKKK